MRLADLLKLQQCFHEADHAACWGLPGVVSYPVEKLSLWNEEQLDSVVELSKRLAEQAAVVGDEQLRAELLAVALKATAAVKRARQRRKEVAAEARAAKKAGAEVEPDGDGG